MIGTTGVESSVDAVEEGKFAVWAVQTIDEAVALLTGTPADDVNQKVEEQLVAYAKQRKRFAEEASNNE